MALIDGVFFARTWDADSRALISAIESPLPQFRFLALNAYGTRLTIGSLSNELAVFDTASALKISPPMRHLYEPAAMIASGDRRRVVSFGLDGRGCVWDATTGASVLNAICLDTERRAAVDLARDGETVLLFPEASRDGAAAISVWRGTKTRPSRRQRIAGQRNFASSALSPRRTPRQPESCAGFSRLRLRAGHGPRGPRRAREWRCV